MVTFYWVYNCLGIQDHPRMIYQKGSGNIRDEPTETTLHAITKEPTESLLGNSCKLKLIITEVKSPDDWCYMSCMDCWKKTVPSSTTARNKMEKQGSTAESGKNRYLFKTLPHEYN